MGERFVRYIEGKSIIYGLDPRAKIIFVFLFILSTLAARGLIEVAFLLVAGFVFYMLARLPFRETCATWRFLILVIVVLSFLNLFTLTLLYPKGGTVLAEWGPIKITEENLLASVTPVLRLLSIATVTLALVFTTPTNLYAPALGQLGVPYKAAYVVELSFRYIPEMFRELRKTLEAQMARGYRPRGGKNPLARILQVVPLILPVTVSSALNVYDIAYAMELRGFVSEKCHTWYRELRFSFKDYLLVIIGASIFLAFLLKNFIFRL